jgi:hypothetical protein
MRLARPDDLTEFEPERQGRSNQLVDYGFALHILSWADI